MKCYICLYVINKLYICFDILIKCCINGYYRFFIDLFFIIVNYLLNVKWGYVVVSLFNLFFCWFDVGFLWVWCGYINLCVNVNIYLDCKSG